MTLYDDADSSCSYCTIGLDADALCDCAEDPCCVRCHGAFHVERIEPDARRSPEADDDIGDELMRRALSAWGQGGVA